MGIVTLWCDEYIAVGEGVRVKVHMAWPDATFSQFGSGFIRASSVFQARHGPSEGVQVGWVIGHRYRMCYNQAQDLANSYVMCCQILIIFFASL